ncbi:MAG: hypothetical protein AUJ92_00190 [Armatimonadetes bacterium CG2_30_59_28]|nr:hypothetical protein [Armatimonadota bacterium]OIO99079.1 MAG: hypothetical protein AUJ92_00190 [Armatimonadetes bacterium CG2_30_59_28]PIU66680.1 MAG: hypothetical protein COS85_03890 [Armatimonadetes bacterium CG07_land_8_20_14_0_80_59_28]PIX43841.1 MAG: hypothetical protein COZ56_06195 [Armatimonadetes bacterium CG_4_8_14_3_um_filter_58_9]PIY46975.1 MAG: hypothetical protein COZ05_05415 [Armatimonadetes bacterium CG_4_10_14_3_um_filter_59_10]PJB78578.1 MAG: hypothetical protein CO095_004
MSTSTKQVYESMILRGISDLPPEMLHEVTDFVFFLRQRRGDSRVPEEELRQSLLSADLKSFRAREEDHLMEEFEDYERRYPVE